MTLSTVLQVVLSLGLLNVWLLRSASPTPYRGGEAGSLKREFDAYGLPDWAFYAVGTLKVGGALALLGGLWVPGLVLPSAALVTLLMVGAILMHFKVSDPAVRSLPAALMLAMSTLLVGLQAA